ncbi:hypothetical protein F5Y05DRAFT_420849 [Hypoxylon sp. FL0543]|nr:hypothetical protein F5Y05DRAFT_420849 [Hypoxylon sp. FL0543]
MSVPFGNSYTGEPSARTNWAAPAPIQDPFYEYFSSESYTGDSDEVSLIDYGYPTEQAGDWEDIDYPLAATGRAVRTPRKRRRNHGDEVQVGEWYGPNDEKLCVNQRFRDIVQECERYFRENPGFHGTPQETKILHDFLKKALRAINLSDKLSTIVTMDSLHSPVEATRLVSPGWLNPAHEDADETVNDNIGWNDVKAKLRGYSNKPRPFGQLRGGAAPEERGPERREYFKNLRRRIQAWFTDHRVSWDALEKDATMPQQELPPTFERLPWPKGPLMYPNDDMGADVRKKHAEDFEVALGDHSQIYASAKDTRTNAVFESKKGKVMSRIETARLSIEKFLVDHIRKNADGKERFLFESKTAGNEAFRKVLTEAFILRMCHLIKLTITSLQLDKNFAKVTIDTLMQEEILYARALIMHEEVWIEYDNFRRFFWLSNNESADNTNARIALRKELILWWEANIELMTAARELIKKEGEDNFDRPKVDPNAREPPLELPKNYIPGTIFMPSGRLPTTSSSQPPVQPSAPAPTQPSSQAPDAPLNTKKRMRVPKFDPSGDESGIAQSDGQGDTVKGGQDQGRGGRQNQSRRQNQSGSQKQSGSQNQGGTQGQAQGQVGGSGEGGGQKDPIEIPADSDEEVTNPIEIPADSDEETRPAKKAKTQELIRQAEDIAQQYVLDHMRALRRGYLEHVDRIRKENEELDAGDKGDVQQIQLNNIDIMAKSQQVWQLDVEIENVKSQNWREGGRTASSVQHRYTVPPAHEYWKDTKRIEGRKDLPTSITSYAPGNLPGEHPRPGLPRVLIGAPAGFGGEPNWPDDDTGGIDIMYGISPEKATEPVPARPQQPTEPTRSYQRELARLLAGASGRPTKTPPELNPYMPTPPATKESAQSGTRPVSAPRPASQTPQKPIPVPVEPPQQRVPRRSQLRFSSSQTTESDQYDMGDIAIMSFEDYYASLSPDTRPDRRQALRDWKLVRRTYSTLHPDAGHGLDGSQDYLGRSPRTWTRAEWEDFGGDFDAYQEAMAGRGQRVPAGSRRAFTTWRDNAQGPPAPAPATSANPPPVTRAPAKVQSAPSALFDNVGASLRGQSAGSGVSGSTRAPAKRRSTGSSQPTKAGAKFPTWVSSRPGSRRNRNSAWFAPVDPRPSVSPSPSPEPEPAPEYQPYQPYQPAQPAQPILRLRKEPSQPTQPILRLRKEPGTGTSSTRTPASRLSGPPASHATGPTSAPQPTTPTTSAPAPQATRPSRRRRREPDPEAEKEEPPVKKLVLPKTRSQPTSAKSKTPAQSQGSVKPSRPQSAAQLTSAPQGVAPTSSSSQRQGTASSTASTAPDLAPLRDYDGWPDLQYLIKSYRTAHLAEQALGQRPSGGHSYAVPLSRGEPEYPVPIKIGNYADL